jgi:hypothetical protein
MRAKLVLLCTLALLGATTAGLTIAPAAAAAPADVAAAPALTVPITGTGVDTSFVGQFALQGFRVVNGQLSAVGQLTGTLTNTVTGATQSVSQLLTIPLASATGTCQILHLELGPLDLNLLGLMVHLDKVVLDITAQPGPGNLLGNLLCSVAHLLDSSASGQGLASLLNQVLRILG